MPRLPEGVLNSDQMRDLEGTEIISRTGGKIKAEGSAMDLHLGSQAWELRGSIKQIATKETVAEVCEAYGDPLTVSDLGTQLLRGKTYVVQLQESVAFSNYPGLFGEATGKSSVGRLDVLTRLLVNGAPEYERVPTNYRGPLYIEIVPISFPVIIKPGISLNQLRIHCGGMNEMPTTVGRRMLFDSVDRTAFSVTAQERKTLSVHLESGDTNETVAYGLLKRNDLKPVDLSAQKKTINPGDYFEPISALGDSLIMEVNRFYILRSVERLRLPEDVAVTGMAYSENLGELRIHYAGFAHPWFGKDRTDKRIGTPLIFEVRAHNFPIVLRHKEVLATIRFYSMSCPIPDGERRPGAYSEQELKLSGYFSDWPRS
jgi:dCTP deaminase